MKLIEFDKGVWIDPETVTAITAQMQIYHSETRVDRPAVFIRFRGDCHVIFCDSIQSAREMADELAKKANGMVKV